MSHPEVVISISDTEVFGDTLFFEVHKRTRQCSSIVRIMNITATLSE